MNVSFIVFMLALALSSANSANAEGLSCKQAVQISSEDSGLVATKILNQEARLQKDSRVYPNSMPKLDGNHLMYGFESEFTMVQLDTLLAIYRPRQDLGVSKSAWLKLTPVERVDWVKARAKSLEAGSKDIGLVLDRSLKLLNGEEIPKYLTEQLIVDETGNLEIVQDPVDTYEEFVSQAEWITKNLGAGSMQGTVTSVKESFFNQDKEGLVGFFTFFGQSDPLQKLKLGADRYEKDPTKQIAKSFNHPFLGPLTRIKQAFLAQFVRFNSKGLSFQGEAKEFIAGRDDSFKYSGMVSYRPDIGGKLRVGTEVRDAHNDVDLLNQKVAKAAYFHQNGMSAFKEFGKIKSFDSIVVFSQMKPELQEMLKTLFPLKLKPGYTYVRSEVISREVYRNFSFPMQDWTPWLQALENQNLAGQVKAAQEKYISRLEEAQKQLSAKEITEQEASTKVQGALAMFSKESGLASAFENFLLKTFNNK